MYVCAFIMSFKTNEVFPVVEFLEKKINKEYEIHNNNNNNK